MAFDLNPESMAEKQEGLTRLTKDNIAIGRNAKIDLICNNIKHSITLGLPQVFPMGQQAQRVCIVGGGPSLEDTFDELLKQYWEGAKIIALNGSYNWLVEHRIKPSAHVIIDAREFNARFIGEHVPGCKYFIASQCAPGVFAKVIDREIYIIHCCSNDTEKDILREYYLGDNWKPVIGGSTVALRAIGLFVMLGYRYLDLYGVDSCYRDDKHHVYEQEENETDEVKTLLCGDRYFKCAHWMANQQRDFLTFIAKDGNKFSLNVHGDGLLAYVLEASAQIRLEDLKLKEEGE